MQAENHSHPSLALVAIAKNESFYLTEWISHHFSVGFEHIRIYNNDSTDKTLELLTALSRLDERIEVVDWPSQPKVSPQTSAYNHAVSELGCEWVCFIDIDEFLVPWEAGTVQAFLSTIPADVSALHVNWRGFGSNGVTSPDYGLVTESFTTCSHAKWMNNNHYKTIARVAAIEVAHIHHVDVKYGRRVMSDMSSVPDSSHGIADAPVYNGVQINHYQCKTFEEFQRRMHAGSAFRPTDHPRKIRDASFERFVKLDQNSERDNKITAFSEETKKIFLQLESRLPLDLRSGTMRKAWLDTISAT